MYLEFVEVLFLEIEVRLWIKGLYIEIIVFGIRRRLFNRRGVFCFDLFLFLRHE